MWTRTLLLLALAAPAGAQDYVELRGSSTRYRFVDFNRTLASRLIVDALYIGVPGQDELYLGAGRSLQLTRGVAFAPYVYAVAGFQQGERGLVLGGYLTVERGPLRVAAFLGRFVRLAGGVESYDFADSIDVGGRVGRWEGGGSTTIYRTGVGWSAVSGPVVRRHDGRGAWSVSLRSGYETEFRVVRSLTF
jgi:hypothetical protein